MRFKPTSPDLNRFRNQLARVDALPQLTLLGLITGIFTALVIMMFRELITFLSSLFLAGLPEEAFMDMSWDIRIFLPLIGSLALITIALFTHKNYRQVGIIHVIERLDWHQARLTLGNLLNQFFAGAIAIASGHSIGREGPAVHLGAGTASLLGQSMKLPNNSLRILVACGSAAAISAAFNTPVAGVIFSLEVLMVEYTLSGFLPVMLASASAAIITQTVYGTDPAFIVPPISTDLLHDLPLILTTGVVMGILGAFFCQLLAFFVKRSTHLPLFLRLIAAAAITGLIAIPAPAIMGVGYGTITELMSGDLYSPLFLALILFAKLLASSASLGLGVPGGLIGPTLFMGAAAGALCASVMGLITGTESVNTGFPCYGRHECHARLSIAGTLNSSGHRG